MPHKLAQQLISYSILLWLFPQLALCLNLTPGAGLYKEKKDKKIRAEASLKSFLSELFTLEEIFVSTSQKSHPNLDKSLNKLTKKITPYLSQEFQKKIFTEMKSIQKKKHPQEKIENFKKFFFTELEIPYQPNLTPDFKRAQHLYKKLCTSCHGIEGKGKGILHKKLAIPDLSENGIFLSSYPFKYYHIISNGRKKMPKFSNHLSKNELWDLSFYVSQLPFKKERVNSTSPSVNLSYNELSRRSNAYWLYFFQTKEKITAKQAIQKIKTLGRKDNLKNISRKF